MSYEEKLMARPSSSSNTMTQEASNLAESMSMISHAESGQAPNVTSEASHGPVAILWDIENCPVPSDVRPEDVAGNIRMALRVHPVIRGAVTMFSAYGDFNAFPRRLREGCQRTGVKLVDVPNGRKDAADKAILVDMFLFALDNRPPSSILLISGDVDFAPALHILGQRGYTVILVIPAGVGVSSALSNAGRFVWDWPSVARGEGFVPPKHYTPRATDLSGYLMNCNVSESHDCQNEEEAIVYRGASQSEYNTRANFNQMYPRNSSYMCKEPSRTSYSYAEYGSNNYSTTPFHTSSRSQSLPSSLCEAPNGDQSGMEDLSWVQPGDIQGLKGQIFRLLEMSGGTMPLVRIPSEYLKIFGRPLYMAEYGAYKLVNLIRKMGDCFLVVGKGPKKWVCLRNPEDLQLKKCQSTPTILRKDKKEKGPLDENVDSTVNPNTGSSSDGFSDDAVCGLDERIVDSALSVTYEYDSQFEALKQEVQELLVCYSCPVPFGNFVSLYEQRYKKPLDFKAFGVDGLEGLIEKVSDVVELREEKGSKRKYLVSC
ncbi:LOW QUALITY PROTEIN: uncharacterized protein LOC120250397 [Dioscorea cayenensis subsp. rotundata]|uniref:LOW QUALITY PROTEIN: uncharacterized protein LOC120250397 n=1 Tax=Dioscorea cayennensis subsp. rotundata TaxID=55577 RepID=A0AB40AJP3_DIOCR|nr:LOW QUALITY PROTEIN: uncharacterized protein LOC120250397 [Dioscorea cayenensis subsp. rotundata]